MPSACPSDCRPWAWRSIDEGFEVVVHESVLQEPLKWKNPTLVFVNSMSDLFHKAVPTEFVQSVFGVMNQASQHTF